MATFKHVLAATDFSETSGRALEMAVGIARDAGAELSVVHVCEIPPYTDFAAPLDLVTPASDLAQTKLDELLSSIRDVCPRVKGSSGSARRGRRSSPSPPSAARTSSSSALTGAAASRTRSWAASRSASCGCPRSRC